METKEVIKIVRNVFYKCFFVGLIFLIVAAAIYLPSKLFIAETYQTIFGISESAYQNMWAGFIGIIKTILIFFFLVPALAMHWTVCKCKKDK